jgi:hypothetical protein
MKLINTPETSLCAWFLRSLIGPATILDGIAATLTLSKFNFGLKFKTSLKLNNYRQSYNAKKKNVKPYSPGIVTVNCNPAGKFWRTNGKLHREDGPAIEWFDGYTQWFLNGIELTKEEYSVAIIESKGVRA